MPFTFEPLEIPEVILVTPQVFGDDRGFFMESYKRSDFVDAGIDLEFLQDSHSKSKKGVIRGLHYQKDPHVQGKLVWVIRGSLYDVAVDIRVGSPTFGKWVSATLTAENRQMLWIPPGFAHGVCILEDDTELLYKNTGEYSPESEGGILWNDSELAIDWPISDPVLSEKDQKHPPLAEADNNFVYSKSKSLARE